MMNGHGNMTPLSTQYQNPSGNDGGKRTGVLPFPITPASPYSQVPPLTLYPAGSPHFSPGPRCTNLPSPTFSYLPQTSPSSTSFHTSLPPVYPSPSSSRRDSLPPKYPSPSSSRRDSLPPVCPSPSSSRRDSFPHFNPGPRSVTQLAPVFSSLPLSAVYSSLPPVTPSLSSVRRNSLPPMYPSPSAHVENRDSSIGFNRNPSPLPPRVPVTRSNSMSASGSNTLPPRKSHKRTDGDIIGINSTIPLNPPESSYPPPSDLLVGESSCDKEGVVEWTYDKKARKEFFNEFMILDNTNNDANGNETVDDVMITFSNSDENGFKTGPTTSGVKRRAGKDIDPSTRHYESVPMDSSFNDMLKPSPSPGNLPVDGTENSFSFKLGNGEYTSSELKKIAGSTRLTQVAADPKRVRRILANREAAARSKQRKSQYVVFLEHRVDTLQYENTSMSRTITVLEKDKMMMMNENKEMKIRVESLEKEGQLREEILRLKVTTVLNGQESVDAQRLKDAIALNEQLCAEIERLKVAAGEVMQNHGQFDGSNMQPLDPNMFQQLNINQFNQFNQPQPNFDFYGQN